MMGLLFVTLPNRGSSAITGLGGEIGRAIFAGCGEAKLHGVAVEFINAKLSLAGVRPAGDPVVNVFGFGGWIERELRLHQELTSDHDCGLVSLAGSLGTLKQIARQGLAVSAPAGHRPFALQLRQVLLRRFRICAPRWQNDEGDESNQ